MASTNKQHLPPTGYHLEDETWAGRPSEDAPDATKGTVDARGRTPDVVKGIAPNREAPESDLPLNSEWQRSALRDSSSQISSRPYPQLIDWAQDRVADARATAWAVAEISSDLETTRRKMKAIIHSKVYEGLSGNNEKQRDADLYVKLMDDPEYPDLFARELSLQNRLRKVEAVYESYRQMSRLEGVLIGRSVDAI